MPQSAQMGWMSDSVIDFSIRSFDIAQDENGFLQKDIVASQANL